MKESGGPRQAFRLSGDLGGANFPDDAPPVDGRATVEERFSARPLTSDLGNSTAPPRYTDTQPDENDGSMIY